jgi:HK97 family phage major capsid protein
MSEPIPNQWISDVDQLEDFLDGELRAMVTEEVNAQIVAGAGSGEDLVGLMETSDVQVQPFDTDILRTLRKARTKVGLVYDGLTPDGLLLHPSDAEALDLVQDGEQRYYLNRGPVGAGPDDPVWKTPVTETKSVPVGSAIMGNFAAGVLAYVRDEIQVTWSDSALVEVEAETVAAFQANLRVYRAEARVGLAVLRPAALVVVSLSAEASS